MKSLFLPIVFAFCFVIMLAGTKAVPLVKHHQLVGLEIRLAIAVRFRPQLVRKSQYTLLIGILFRTLGWKQIRYFPSCSYLIRFSLPKERKDYIGLRIHWSNPCRFNSCRPHHIKTKASGFLERMSGGFFLWLRLAKKQARDITSNSRKSCLII